MLSLVLGSATHSFELMLSAFILGLALGAWAIRRRVDRAPNPVRLLGKIQVAMGLAALASLPLYLTTFWVMPSLVTDLPGGPGAYAWFNLSKYGLCLVVMLPATVLAGMTLPVITGTLLHSGYGERSIGRVYGINTIGSVVGAALAGLLALPLLGLKGLVVAGAALDIALGVWVLDRAAAWAGTSRRPAGVLALGAGAATVAVMLGVVLEPALLTSGVFRHGRIPESGDSELLFYRHGRTATVAVQVYASDPVVTKGGGMGQGILLVEGDLDLRGGFLFYGSIIVQGNFETQGNGNRIIGAVMASNGLLDDQSIAGGSEITYSKCTIQRAILNNSSLSRARPLELRSWVDLSAVTN